MCGFTYVLRHMGHPSDAVSVASHPVNVSALSMPCITSCLSPTVELLEFKLQQDRAMSDDLRSSLDDEKGHVREMSGQLSEDRTSRSRFQIEIGDMQSRITLLQDALVREQARLVSTS